MRRYQFHVWYKLIEKDRQGEFRTMIFSARKVLSPSLLKHAEEKLAELNGFDKENVIITNYRLVAS